MFLTKRKKLNKRLFSALLKRGAIGAFLLFFITQFAFAAPQTQKTTNQTNHHTVSITKHKPSTHKSHQTKKSKSKTKNNRHKVKSKAKPQTKPKIPSSLKTLTNLTPMQDSIFAIAEAQLGKKYVWGGSSPQVGFDCSGLSQYVYRQEGITIPRTALNQYQDLAPVNTLQPGDLVFFRISSRYVSHVGIYLGKGYFIHSPTPGQRIRIDELKNSYWKKHYAGARRPASLNSSNFIGMNQSSMNINF